MCLASPDQGRVPFGEVVAHPVPTGDPSTSRECDQKLAEPCSVRADLSAGGEVQDVRVRLAFALDELQTGGVADVVRARTDRFCEPCFESDDLHGSSVPDGRAPRRKATSETDSTVRPMRLIVARCEVTYSGRLSAYLPESTRLLMLKEDGSVLVHADAGGYKPLNWMTPPTVVEEDGDLVVVRKRARKSEDRLEIRLHEVLSDLTHDMGEAAALEKDGVERHLQEELAAQPETLEQGLRLVRREWPTDVGPVDLMCRDADDGWVAVEIKRVATIDAVEQLSRYLERIQLDPALAECRGVLAAEQLKPQAVTLADSRGIGCVRVDLAVLRGEREPELTLFAV